MVKVLINSETNVVLFRRMNQQVVNKYTVKQGQVPNMAEHIKNFESMHGIKITMAPSGNFWEAMVFPTEADYTMAMLKWM